MQITSIEPAFRQGDGRFRTLAVFDPGEVINIKGYFGSYVV